MIEEILDLHFTDIKTIFQPVFDVMTSESKAEMRSIFGDNTIEDIEENKLSEAVQDGFNDGYEEGHEVGYAEGFEDGHVEGSSGS